MGRRRVCKSCRFWAREPGKVYGKCSSDRMVYVGGGLDTGANQLGYWDCESYGAGVEVGESFGCVHWELKANTEGRRHDHTSSN